MLLLLKEGAADTKPEAVEDAAWRSTERGRRSRKHLVARGPRLSTLGGYRLAFILLLKLRVGNTQLFSYRHHRPIDNVHAMLEWLKLYE